MLTFSEMFFLKVKKDLPNCVFLAYRLSSCHSKPMAKEVSLAKCYELLNVSEHCSNEQLKESYLKIAKNLHPDTGSKSSDVKKLAEIQGAYNKIIDCRKCCQKDEEAEEEASSFKHKILQHRQYLEYNSGSGTLSERFKQHEQKKVSDAFENLQDYRVKNSNLHYENFLIESDRRRSKRNLVRTAIDRLVEDLIAESMGKGDFDNLPGSGKPLDSRYKSDNPYIDTTTYNLNRILLNNGYVPRWVSLEKEIRKSYEDAKLELIRVRHRILTMKDTKDVNWKRCTGTFREEMKAVNKNIDKFNIMTPSMVQQIFHYDIENELHVISSMTSVDETAKILSLHKNDNGTNDDLEEDASNKHMFNSFGPTSVSISFREIWNEWRALFGKLS